MTCSNPADVGLLLDSSASTTGNWNMLLQATQDIVYRFDIGRDAIQVGVVQFSQRGRIEFNLNAYQTQSSIANRIATLRPMSASTNMADGLQVLQSLFTGSRGDRAGHPNRAVLITDGRGDDPDLAVRAASRLKQAGIHLTVVGVGQDVDRSELELLASDSAGVVYVTAFSGLSNAVDRIVRSVCPPVVPGRS